jgi:hypothetical protein
MVCVHSTVFTVSTVQYVILCIYYSTCMLYAYDCRRIRNHSTISVQKSTLLQSTVIEVLSYYKEILLVILCFIRVCVCVCVFVYLVCL